jgi:outer membrane protein
MSNRIVYLFCATLLLTGISARSQVPAVGSPRPQETSEKARLKINLKEAVAIALGPEGNVMVQIAEASVDQARWRSAQARAALLPNVDSSVGQQSQTRNLLAFGINPTIPIPGFVFPTFAGPYSVFDARLTASQSLLDLSAIRKYQASRVGIGQTEAERENSQDKIRDQVARAYLAALRAEAHVGAAQSNIDLAHALLKLASDQKSAGTGTGIEITRAQVQLANEKQRLLIAQNDLKRAQLQLLRTIGQDLTTNLELSDQLGYQPAAPVTLEQALQTAWSARADWQVQQRREQAVRMNQSAVRLERVPSVNLFADYGSIGPSINQAIPTRSYGFLVRVPIFDGGRRDARRAESASQLLQEVARTRDLRAQIEMEIRLALDALQSAEDQVQTSREGLSLARNELEQSQRRLKTGVGSGIEVTDAQTRFERAQDNQISALFNYALAQIDLQSAMGTIRRMVQ